LSGNKQRVDGHPANSKNRSLQKPYEIKIHDLNEEIGTRQVLPVDAEMRGVEVGFSSKG